MKLPININDILKAGAMLKNVLNHIKSRVMEEKVVKHPDRAEAHRFFNYPFAAIEESLCNAV